MEKADKDKSGKIDLTEFSDLVSAYLPARSEKYKQIFMSFVDKDLSGNAENPAITFRSLKMVADGLSEVMGKRFTSEELCWMISSADGDGNKVICEKEFMSIMLKTSVLCKAFSSK